MIEGAGHGIREEVRRFGREFMRDGVRALRRLQKGGKPLEGHTETEGLNSGVGEREVAHPKKRERDENQEEESGDPLDEKDGTEDW